MSKKELTPEQIKEWIWSKCEEDGDCLIWTGALAEDGAPQMRDPATNKTRPARRVLMEAMGKSIQGLIATTRCGCKQCMAEGHVVAWSRRKLQERSGKKLAANLPRAAKIAAIRRETAKLDMEQARAMRESGLTTREAAQRWGVTQSTAAKTMRGDYWKEYGGNPFQGLGGRV